MGREWKPGDLALIRVGTGDWEPGLRQDDDTWACAHTCPRPERTEVEVAHRLVIIDAEDREQVRRLRKSFRNEGGHTPGEDGVAAMQAALRSLIAPPKPDEPTGKWAVVVDADDVEWVRTCAGVPGNSVWLRDGWLPAGRWTTYDGINVVRVLAEGMTP